MSEVTPKPTPNTTNAAQAAPAAGDSEQATNPVAPAQDAAANAAAVGAAPGDAPGAAQAAPAAAVAQEAVQAAAASPAPAETSPAPSADALPADSADAQPAPIPGLPLPGVAQMLDPALLQKLEEGVEGLAQEFMEAHGQSGESSPAQRATDVLKSLLGGE